MANTQTIHIFVNQVKFSVENSSQTGKSLKEIASIPDAHTLFVGSEKGNESDQCGSNYAEICDDQPVVLKNGQHYWSRDSSAGVDVVINLKQYHFDTPCQTGQEIKEKAGIEFGDVLFLNRPSEDEVVPNNAKFTLHCGDTFYSSPPANYGYVELSHEDVGTDQFECITQPDGWTFLVINRYGLPDGFSHCETSLLVKLPPGFPDAAPDMFWVKPHIRTSAGGVPHGASNEVLLGEMWQRFSWHLQAGAWRPGISTLRDYMRCIRARFERRN